VKDSIYNVTSPKRMSRAAFLMATYQLIFCAQAQAQNANELIFHLASAPLDQTLVQIAQTANLRLSYDAALVRSVKSTAVNGLFSPEAAIRQSLLGTGLVLVSTPGGALTILPAEKAPPNTTKDAPASAVTNSTALASTSATPRLVDNTLPLISVAAQRDSGGTGFVAESSSTYTRTDAPLSDTPKSVSVVNAAVIQSQNAENLTDILRNVAGVNATPNIIGVPSYSVRGYSGAAANGNVMTDGLAVGMASSAGNLTPSIAISSVEVIKGPSAIIAGDSPPGGVVNITKKTPQAEAFHELQTSYGTYGKTQIAFDSTGALSEDRKLRYRFIVSGDKVGQNQMGYDGQRDSYVAPTLQWKDSSTDFTVGFSRTTARIPVPAYTMGYEDGAIYAHGFDYPLGNPADHFSIRSNQFTAKLEQKLTDHITFVSRAGYEADASSQTAWGAATSIAADDTAYFFSTRALSNFYTWSLQNYLRAKFDVGSMKTTTLIGIDYTRWRMDQQNPTSSTGFPSLNVFNPQTLPGLAVAGATTGYGAEYRKTGLYLQEQVSYGRLHVLGSLRADRYSSQAQVGTRPAQSAPRQTAYSPSIGVLYQLTDFVAAYASYNKGFLPANSTTFSGELLPPMRSEQIEIGTKWNLLDDKLALTTALYRISYDNEAVSDPIHSGYSIAAGGAVSRGFEVEATGQVLPGLNVIGSYSYNDYVQPYSPSTVVHLPKHKASLWATYNFQVAGLHGFGVGGGVFLTSGQDIGQTAGLYRIPTQVQTDASLFYQAKKYRLNLSVMNLFNRHLYYSSSTESFIPMGTGRTFLLTGTYDF
jgi:iron complex outermembrane recepter protein